MATSLHERRVVIHFLGFFLSPLGHKIPGIEFLGFCSLYLSLLLGQEHMAPRGGWLSLSLSLSRFSSSPRHEGRVRSPGHQGPLTSGAVRCESKVEAADWKRNIRYCTLQLQRAISHSTMWTHARIAISRPLSLFLSRFLSPGLWCRCFPFFRQG